VLKGVMSKRIVAPDEMVHAAWVAWGEPDCAGVRDVVEAALLWLSENPTSPNEDQTEAIRGSFLAQQDVTELIEFTVLEWQRRMFLAPEPEVLEPIKDLLCGGGDAEAYFRPDIYNDRIVEAYRRGRSDAK